MENNPNAPLTDKSDIYSLGITYFEIIYATVLADELGAQKTASDYTSGSEYLEYLTKQLQPKTSKIDEEKHSLLKLFGLMVSVLPENRPPLQNILEFLRDSKNNNARNQKRYKSKMEPNKYIWHPDIHKRFSESKYFFLLSGGNPKSDFAYIKADLKALGLSSYSLNTYSGFWDYLLEFWLNEERLGVEKVVKTLARTVKKMMLLKVTRFEGSRSPKKLTLQSASDGELASSIEKDFIDGGEALLLETGAILEKLTMARSRNFRVLSVVEIHEDESTMIPAYAAMIKKAIAEHDKQVKNLEISIVTQLRPSADIASTNQIAQNETRLVVQFIHSNFIKCRSTVVELTKDFHKHGDRFRFSTAFHMKTDDDFDSDDGAILQLISENIRLP